MKYEVETRFNVGDDVWILDNNRPRKMHIIGIVFDQCEYEERTNCSGEKYIGRYRGGFHYHFLGMPTTGYEYKTFASKEELVNSLLNEGDSE